MNIFYIKSTFYLIALSFFLTGCQPKVYLMPPPVGIGKDAILFELSKENEDENLLSTLYATNRIPADVTQHDTRYTIFPSNTLRLGFVVDRIGEERMSWKEVVDLSMQKEREEELLVKMVHSREMASYSLEADLNQTTAQANGFFDQINQMLEKSIDKDILVYVHGANSSFYRATAQGAQLFHFGGHNSVVLTFSWPSAESLLKYKIDVAHAKKTVPAFSRLIELLATHTKARHINILAYSAGAQVTAPGLASFSDQYPNESKEDLKKRLRIGEVYFAAPDTAFEPFIKRYIKFKDIVERTTVNVNTDDSVLMLSEFKNGVSRLGKPDAKELSEEEGKILLAASQTLQLNFLDIQGSEALDAGGAHDTWYAHPWVSSDLIMLLLFNAGPLERGLEEHVTVNGALTYRFPANYEQKLRNLIDNNGKQWKQRLEAESNQLSD